jgi:hypothetical protein
MAVNSPTLSIATTAAFNEPSLFVSLDLFPRCPIPGAAVLPGSSKAVGVAYRYAKNDIRKQPGQRNLEKVPLQQATRVSTGYESYDIESQFYEIEEAMPKMNLENGAAIGLSSTYAGHVSTKLATALLQDQETRCNDIVSVDGNFATVIDGSTAGPWSDATTNPWANFDAAINAINKNFGSPERGMSTILVLTTADYFSLINNPFFTAKWGDATAPLDFDAMERVIGSYINGMLPAELRTKFRLRVAGATGYGDQNIGQTGTPDYLFTAGSVLARTMDAVGSGDGGLMRRSYGKGYNLVDPSVETYTDDGIDAIIYRAKMANTLSVYDTTGGVKFKNMTA